MENLWFLCRDRNLTQTRQSKKDISWIYTANYSKGQAPELQLIPLLSFEILVSFFSTVQVFSSQLEKMAIDNSKLPPSGSSLQRKGFPSDFRVKNQASPAQFGTYSPCDHPDINCCSLNVQDWITSMAKSQGPVSGKPSRITWLG